jgi:hypothetical protein
MFLSYFDDLDLCSGITSDGLGFEELLAIATAHHFPSSDEKSMDEGAANYSVSALSPFTGSSGSSSTISPRFNERDKEDSESDVDPSCLDTRQPRARSSWVHFFQQFRSRCSSSDPVSTPMHHSFRESVAPLLTLEATHVLLPARLPTHLFTSQPSLWRTLTVTPISKATETRRTTSMFHRQLLVL